MGPPKSTTSATNGVAEDVTTKHTSKSSNSPETRIKMKNYWQVYSPSLESMMLSHDALMLSAEEQAELVEYLPQNTYQGKKVLELGAGIGRYTTILSEAGVAELTAVDFMESYVKENEKINGHKENVRLLCADVTKLNFSPCSFDLVFSNWLLMYLSDSEVTCLMQRALSWVKPGGYIFFRESCYHQSGNVARKENPTLYRTPLDYLSTLDHTLQDGHTWRLIKAKNIRAYVKHYGNPNQLCFLARKSVIIPGSVSSRYSAPQTLLTEAAYGRSWSATGGSTVANVLSKCIGDVVGKVILDANSCTGGLSLHLCQQGALKVQGVCSDPHLLHLTLKTQASYDKDSYRAVSFECADIENYSSAYRYDVIIYNDLPSDINICNNIIASLKTLLKSTGRLFVTGYTSTVRNEYPTLEELRSTLTGAGFKSVTLTDYTDTLTLSNEEALNTLNNSSEQDQISDSDKTYMIQTITAKIQELSKGQLSWTMAEASA